ncbi:hypothetical protein [Winogradskyella forsetii]|nr:hypothetical protein [Winogradskyella forsetii]
MNIYNFDKYNRAIFYAEHLILKPLSELKFDDYDKKQFADLICDGINKSKSIQQLSSDFGHYTKNWNIDWHWISHHILSDYHNLRRASELQNMMFSENKLVYKELPKYLNPEFNKLYLTDPKNPESQPKLFKLNELIENGTNIGLKKSEWKPTVGITDFGFYEFHPYNDITNDKEIAHYFDNGILTTLPTGYEWNVNEKEFKMVKKPLTERQKKIRSLVKIKITNTDK